jgi:DNA-binding MarR family transcriptional regulator
VQAINAQTQSLAHQLQALWAHVMRASGTGFLQVLEEYDLSLTQLKTLTVLQSRDDISVKQVGESLQLSLPAASRAVDGLVQRGLVHRSECAADRRSKLVRLADPGRQLIQRVEADRFRGLAAFVDSLDEAQRDALAAALSPIVEGLPR